MNNRRKWSTVCPALKRNMKFLILTEDHLCFKQLNRFMIKFIEYR